MTKSKTGHGELETSRTGFRRSRREIVAGAAACAVFPSWALAASSDAARFFEVAALGSDHVLWGTDTPVQGPPHWQIQAFQAYSFPADLVESKGYPVLTPEIKRQILGENAARLYNIDIASASHDIAQDLLYRLRTDGNPLPREVDPGAWSSG